MFGQPNYYNPPMPDQLAQLRNPYIPQPVQPPQPQHSNGIIWVQGEAGAKSYLVAPGQSLLLMDSENSKFYIKAADQSGMPMPLRVFDYKESTQAIQNAPSAPIEPQQEYVTRKEFDALAAQIEALRAQEVQHE